MDTTAMTGAETGARADVGIWAGEGSEAETGICAEGWEPGLAETGGRGGGVCIWRWEEVGPEGAQTGWDWNWVWVWRGTGTGGELEVGVCAGCEPVAGVEIGAWGLAWIRVGVEGEPCLEITLGLALCVESPADVATWRLEATGGGVEASICAAGCAKQGGGEGDTCGCGGADGGADAGNGAALRGDVACVGTGTQGGLGAQTGCGAGLPACVGAGRGAAICVLAKADGVVWTWAAPRA